MGILVALAIGYFAGREHVKYEMRSAVAKTAEGFAGAWKKAFEGFNTARLPIAKTEAEPHQVEDAPAIEKRDYIAKYLKLSAIESKFYKDLIDDRVAGVWGEVKNTGTRILKKVEVTA